MKLFYLIFITQLFFFISCDKSKEENFYEIDLESTTESIHYSLFTDSVSYITLNTNDSCIMSGIDRIYLSGNFLFVKDNKKAGILVFDLNGNFLTQINYYGNGANEFTSINSFSIDKYAKRICIYDGNTGKINRYTYNGLFTESIKISNIIRDFAIIEAEHYLFIMPSYRKDMPSGIWIADSLNNKQKELLSNIPEEYEFEFLFTQYNIAENNIYYYDRNWDKLYKIDNDTAIISYNLNIKQAFPADIKKKSEPSASELNGHAMMANFSISSNFLMLTYYSFEENPFKWVLIRKGSKNPIISERLENDIDHIQSSQEYIFFLNDSTWCRMLDPSESDCNITLQLLHIKNNIHS
ncbi:hypothetical protein HMPREF0103_1724 [Bacteroides sp. 2_1_33B]|nr:hypothetical protein HMPREF0103_1724 [Bacteroides sp. 2_1_33B]